MKLETLKSIIKETDYSFVAWTPKQVCVRFKKELYANWFTVPDFIEKVNYIFEKEIS